MSSNSQEILRGESVFSIQTADTFVEEEPTTLEWFQDTLPGRHELAAYCRSLFPFLSWIGCYNLQWLFGDLVAGITIGAVVVPQGMAYATLAELKPQFGLYSSFMGVLVYWFFATSKDITIGPVAVMSTLVGQILAKAAQTDPDVPGFNAKGPTYLVVINTLKGLPRTKLDAAIGLTALFLLYALRYACNYGAKKFPNHKRAFFFAATLRTVFVILLYTLVSWLVNMHHRKKPLFKILGKVPRGFQNAAVPQVDASIINIFEMVAIGVTNIFGAFLGGYPVTGSFSRTAIKSKAGVRTPFAGVITAVLVLLAIYALTAVFFYIPSAALAAVIIHAVGDLITPPNTVYQFWRVSPIEVPIFFAGVFVTIFSSIENAKGRLLGKVKVTSVGGEVAEYRSAPLSDHGTFPKSDATQFEDAGSRTVFLPFDHGDGSNPEVDVQTPYPAQSLKQPRRTNADHYARPGDRPWNDPGPRRGKAIEDHSDRPTLKAVILDFSSVNNVDITSIQQLIDVRNQLDTYASPSVVDWHFTSINNRWTKRASLPPALVYPTIEAEGSHRWKPIFSVAEMGGQDSAAAAAEAESNEKEINEQRTRERDLRGNGDQIRGDSESGSGSDLKTVSKNVTRSRTAVVNGLNRPLFHIDLTSAFQSAVANVRAREAFEERGGRDTGVEA
ncbi:hypothetical protein DID88_007680 [Monilinia fructigena]|uniref:SLC26A/SulP transporter domain-containing protein n=1 Tax=Monilinia fructigena TaxID=38457 RepID=A0A395J435_9HELO|nr:hypothetical protein DID88_007680 [Monilinia fructigena]